jgi:hypothetical protein
MNTAIKENALTRPAAAKIVGERNIDLVLDKPSIFTTREIDSYYNVTEMSASIDCANVDGDIVTLTVLYLIDNADLGIEDRPIDYFMYSFTID